MESAGLLILCWGTGLITFASIWFTGRAARKVYLNFTQRNARIGNPSEAT